MSVVVLPSLLVVAVVGKQRFYQVGLGANSPNYLEVVENKWSGFLTETLVDPIVAAEA